MSKYRGGRIVYLCPTDNIIQSAPDGVSANDHAAWFALEQLEYVYEPIAWDAEIAEHSVWDEYAYNQGAGPASLGYKPYTSKLTQSYLYGDAIAEEGNGQYWQADFGLPQTRLIDITKLPPDAYVSGIQVIGDITWTTPEWGYVIHSLSHNHPGLPALQDLAGLPIADSIYFPNIYASTVAAIPPGSILLNDIAFTPFSMSLALRHESGFSAPSVPPIIRVPFFRFEVYWRAPDATPVGGAAGEEFEIVPFDATATFGASVIQNSQKLEAEFITSGSFTTALSADLYLSGDFLPSMEMLGDTSIIPGVTDISGSFRPGGIFSGQVDSRVGLAASFIAGMAVSGTMRKIGSLSGSMPSTSAYSGNLRRDGILWVDDGDFTHSMSLAASDLRRTLSLSGSMPGSMAANGSLNGEISLAGSMSPAASFSGVAGRESSLSADFVCSMDVSAQSPEAIKGLAGQMIGSQAFFAGLLHLYLEPAREENTIRLQPKSKTIQLQRKAGDIVLVKPEGI